MSVVRLPGRSRDQAMTPVLTDLRAGQGPDHRAIAEDDDGIGTLHDLFQLGRDEHDGQARLGQLADQCLDLGLGADIDPPGRIVEDQDPRFQAQHACEQDLLLVAA